MPPGDADDPMAALERLRSLGDGSPGEADPTVAAPSPRRPLSGRGKAPMRREQKRGRSPKPRTAAAGDRSTARIAAPVVFLVAVIVLISLVFQSGVIGGEETATTPASAPAPAASATKSAKASPTKSATASATSTTKTYTVKSGDTLSGIAVKFGVTVTELQELNPELGSTLAVGDKLVVPAQ